MFDQLQETEPQWLRPLTAMFGADGSTGWMDSDQALEAMAWLGRRVFEQSRVDRGCHTRAGLQAQVRASQAVTNSMAAVQTVRMAQYAATTAPGAGEAGFGAVTWHEDQGDGSDAQGHGDGEVVHPLGFKGEFADVDLGAEMRWTPGQASARLEEAIDAVTKTPRLLAQVGAGRFDAFRLSQVTRELLEAGTATCERVEDELLAAGVTGWTSRRVQARAARVVRRVDPPAQRKTRRRRAKQAIGVFTRPGVESGTTQWDAVLGSKDAWAAYQAVDELARALHQDQTGNKTLGECRADAMTDLILGNASVATTVTVLVPVKARPNRAMPDIDDLDDVPDVPTGEDTDTDLGEGTAADGGGELTAGEAEVARLIESADWDAELARMTMEWDPHASWFTWSESVVMDFPDEGPTSSKSASSSPLPRTLDRTSCADSSSPPWSALRSASCSPPCPGVEGLLPQDVEVPGIGVIPAGVVAEMLRTVGASITRALVDQGTGTLLGVSCGSYRPTAGVRRQVVLRDVHCRFPGCDRPAQFCDVDHVEPWPYGPTRVVNLQLLCRHHHRAKHEGGWSVTMSPDGTCEWTSPTGRTYVTQPGLLDVLADVVVTAGSGFDPPGSWSPATRHTDVVASGP